eukprot:jgi/Phyca11/504234/fgenesh2_kg.PHYCAscaffold_6_\
MRRRRRVMLAAGALAAVAAHCVAVAEPADRRLITFDETHNALTDTVTEVANEAVDTANNIVSALTSSVLGGVTRTDSNDLTTSPSISVAIGGDFTSDEDEAAEKPTTTGSGWEESKEESFNDDDTTPTTIDTSETATPSRVSVTVHSGISHAVSMTKRPGTTSDSTGNESTDHSYTDSATPTAAPARTTQAPASEVSVATEAPVVSVPTPTPITIVLTTPTPPATETPAVAPVTTDSPVVVTAPTDIPAAVGTPVPNSESSAVSGFNPDTDIIDDTTDAPASPGSTSTDTVVIIPDESTVMPVPTTGSPTVDTGNAGPASDIPSTVPATWTDSSGSNSNNDTVSVSSASGEGTSEGMKPGQVHASSSADVSLNGSDTLDVDSSNSSHGPRQKKNKKTEIHSSSGDFSTVGSSSSSTDSSKSSASNSGSSEDGKGGIGGFLNPGGVSDVNTSSATYYSLGTGSIVAIIGVIAGIMGLLVLFVAISKKKYSDDDGESPLPYGYNMDIRSVARLSPTFMQDDSFMESGYNGTALMVAVAPPTYDGASSTSGESADEVPSLRGHRMITNQCDPLGDISLRSRVPSMQSFSGDLDTGNVRVSALYSAGSSVTSGSAISGSWSSVLESDTERQPSRNTRDTTLSAWSAANLSSFGSTASGASGASGMYRMTRSSSAFSALSGDLRNTGGSDRSRSSSRLAHQPEAPRVAAGPVDSNRSNKSTEI